MPPSSHRAFSPPLSTVSSAQGTLAPLQIKKLLLEGRSRQDGASLRMFLKLSASVDNVQPGTSIPLFPEENIRIVESVAHPLDERSVPFYFSSTEQPLLQKTAAALQLGPKSSRKYHTLFSASTAEPSSSRSRHYPSTQNEERFMPRIVVNNYYVTLVLPKEFPPRTRAVMESDGEDAPVKEPPSSWSARSSRRSSIFNRSFLHMMVGLEIFVPYVTRPPRGPFLVSIPLPKCLDNHLKMRISVKNIVSNDSYRVFDSASSGEDTSGWDFLTEPPVIRKVNKLGHHKSRYTQSAEENVSDSPSVTSSPSMEVIQGAFQSTDFLHIRWAPPLGKRPPSIRFDDGMHRITVPKVTGSLRCGILARDAHSVRMGIDYEATCYELWHPGVAIILGLDITLDTKGRRIYWPSDDMAGWAVTAGESFAGLYSEVTSGRPQQVSRQSSFGSTYSGAFLPVLAKHADEPMTTPARGSASLLRAPLPNQNTPEYSFESSPAATPGPIEKHAPPLDHEIVLSRSDVSPGKVVTLKINSLKHLRLPKNEFTFSVRGIVLIDVEDEDFVPIPTFRILGCTDNLTDLHVCCQTADTHFYLGTEDASPEFKRLLQIGEDVQCDENTGVFVGSLTPSPPPIPSSSAENSPLRRKGPSRNRALARARAGRVDNNNRPRAFEQELPLVLTTVMPLLGAGPHMHCVKMTIPMYSLDSDVVEFSLAMAKDLVTQKRIFTPTVDVLYASYAGRQAHVEVIPKFASSPTVSAVNLATDSQIVGETQLVMMLHLGEIEADTGAVEISYLVGDADATASSSTTKGKNKQEINLNVLLPCFQLPVAHYEVQVECPMEASPFIKYSTLCHRYQTESTKTTKLIEFRLPSGFFPVLSLSLSPSSDPYRQRSAKSRAGVVASLALFKALTPLTLFALLYLIVTIGHEVRELRHTMHTTAQALVPYFEAYWGSTPSEPWNAGTESTPTVTTVVVTMPPTYEKDTNTLTSTINLAEATTVSPPRPTRTRTSLADGGLIPLPALPLLSWRVPFTAETRDIIVKGLMKIWYLVRKAWNFPVDPDE